MGHMTLTINGQPRTASAENLIALVDELHIKPDRVAIELNRQIIPREQWPQTKLNEGDQLEIVHFVGGGSSSDSACNRDTTYPCSTRSLISE
jgi:thiamine biosynthesis protein ThiS